MRSLYRWSWREGRRFRRILFHSLAMLPICNKSFVRSTTTTTPIARRLLACHAHTETTFVSRRMMVGMGVGVALVSSMGGGAGNAKAAARRPPPRPPVEKKDPNLSASQAKILASKKRKEAMKEEVAKLREKGKPTNQQPPQPSILE